MSAPTVEQSGERTPVTEAAPEVPAFTKDDLASLDPSGFLGILVDKTNSVIASLNSSKTRLQQIGGDKVAYAQAMVDSDDADMVKFRDALNTLEQQISQIESKRDEIIAAKFEQSKSASKEEIDSLSTEVSTLEKQVAASRKLLAAEHPDKAVEISSLLTKVVGSYSTGARAGMGEGGRKLRNFTLVIDGKEYDSFSKAAVGLGVKADVLQTAYLNKVGANLNTPAKDLPVGVTEFSVSLDGADHTVTATRAAS